MMYPKIPDRHPRRPLRGARRTPDHPRARAIQGRALADAPPLHRRQLRAQKSAPWTACARRAATQCWRIPCGSPPRRPGRQKRRRCKSLLARLRRSRRNRGLTSSAGSITGSITCDDHIAETDDELDAPKLVAWGRWGTVYIYGKLLRRYDRAPYRTVYTGIYTYCVLLPYEVGFRCLRASRSSTVRVCSYIP